jgi:hypothetical protein
MASIITPQALADELEGLDSEHVAFLNPQTGDLVTLSLEEIRTVEKDLPNDTYPEWQQALMMQARAVLASEAYLQLPTSRDIHEYTIIERFCNAVADGHARTILLNQIRGSGAFRRFKQTIEQVGLVEEWYRFRRAAFEEIAIRWLEAQQIQYRDKNAQHTVIGKWY